MRTGKLRPQSKVLDHWQLLHEYEVTGSAITSYAITSPYNVLMISGEGANNSTTVIDECGKAVTCNGDAKIDTSQFKFGASSVKFDGTGDYLTLASSTDWNLGANDFTIDFWVRFNDITGQQLFVMSQIDANNSWFCGKTGAHVMFFSADVGGVTKASYQSAAWGCANNVWYHVSWTRSGSSMKLFIDGVSQSLTETTPIGTNDIGTTGTLYVGRYGINDSYYVNGWMDDIRISKGIARWTSDFTLLKTTALINGDTDEEYRLLAMVVPAGGSGNVLLRFNNDSTNYGQQYLLGSDSTASAGRSTMTGIYLGGGAVNDLYHACSSIYAKSGYVRTIISEVCLASNVGTTLSSIFLIGSSWNNTTAAIAAMVVVDATTNGLGLGTKFLLYRKVQ